MKSTEIFTTLSHAWRIQSRPFFSNFPVKVLYLKFIVNSFCGSFYTFVAVAQIPLEVHASGPNIHYFDYLTISHPRRGDLQKLYKN